MRDKIREAILFIFSVVYCASVWEISEISGIPVGDVIKELEEWEENDLFEYYKYGATAECRTEVEEETNYSVKVLKKKVLKLCRYDPGEKREKINMLMETIKTLKGTTS